MKISEYFDSLKGENARLIKGLAEHMGRQSAMQTEYDAVDLECVKLAAKLAAERLAGSPRAIATEADLILLRRKRDAIKYNFQRIRNDFQQRIENTTQQIISETGEKWLKLARDLPEKYEYSRNGEIDPRGNIGHVRISTNAEALGEAKTLILQARRELLQMRHLSLSEIEQHIHKFERQYELLDLSVLTVEEVTPEEALERQPGTEPMNISQSIYKYPGMPSFVVTDPDANIAPRLKSLEKKISSLLMQM